MNHQRKVCLDDYHFLQFLCGFSGSRNRVAVDVYWNICSLLVLTLCVGLLYASYAWKDTEEETGKCLEESHGFYRVFFCAAGTLP